MTAIQAIILAGGRGIRMGSITQNIQKCLLPIENKPVLAHIMESLADAFEKIDLIVGVAYKAHEVKEFIDKNKPPNINSVTYVPHVLGTGGWGIYRDMKPYIHGLFVAMPGDVIALPEAYLKVVELFSSENVEAAITLSPDIDVIDTHGVGYISNNKAIRLQWPAPEILHADCLRDMTIWASDQKIFDIIEKYPNPKISIGYVFMDAIKDNRLIGGHRYNLPWLHIGYPEDLHKTINERY
ncbi:MAG: NTP transferase domain-containing protein [Candidatus Paceibacterota bacterium]|jgi:NDP-sugar pyrophosphorylase family protein